MKKTENVFKKHSRYSRNKQRLKNNKRKCKRGGRPSQCASSDTESLISTVSDYKSEHGSNLTDLCSDCSDCSDIECCRAIPSKWVKNDINDAGHFNNLFSSYSY